MSRLSVIISSKTRESKAEEENTLRASHCHVRHHIDVAGGEKVE
jgi:hypothetical protein